MAKRKAAPNLHFISGLPRSGSTLLAALLRQNPRFHAEMSSPVSGLFQAILERGQVQNEFSVVFPEEKRRALLHSVFDVYYEGTDQPVIFDTSRVWCSKLPQLAELYPDAKIICCVRNPAWVMDSFERLFRAHPFHLSRMFSGGERDSVYTRTEALARYDRPVGFGLTAAKDAYFDDRADRLLVVDYDYLAAAPVETLKLIYKFIGEDWFEHDVENVSYEARAFDEHLGVPDLHTVKGAVTPRPRRSILPPDLFSRYADLAFWQQQSNTLANSITPQPVAGNPDGAVEDVVKPG